MPAKLTVIAASPPPTATKLPSLSTVTTDSSEETNVRLPTSSGSNSSPVPSLPETYNLASIESVSSTIKSKESSSRVISVSYLETATSTTTSSAAAYISLPGYPTIITVLPSPTATTLHSSSTVTIELLEEVKVILPTSSGSNSSPISSSRYT